MQELEKAMEILDKLSFFGGQRAGREPWNDKPKEVQDEDIENFNRDIEYLKNFIRRHMNCGWVPVEERLPEKEYDTVLCVTDKNYYLVCVYNKNVGFRISDFNVEGRIVVWRPLPDLYNPKEDN